MPQRKIIQVFEHQQLHVAENELTQAQVDALLRLNDYHHGSYFKPISKGIQFKQYVGVIQIDGLIIEVNPKADKYDEDSKWKGVLLAMLIACGKIKAHSTGSAHVRRQYLNLLHIYFEEFLQEVNYLLNKGLIKQYRTETKTLNP